MTSNPPVELVASKARALRELHAGPRMLVLPNAWDAASARIFEAAGFPAIATTSGGVAASIGFKDREDAPVAEMLAAASRITRSVDVPVSVDFEAGYQLSPEEVARGLIRAGAAGFNFEDTDHHNGGGLVSAELQAERLAAIKSALRSEGADLFLNARVDVFIHRLGTPEEQLEEGLRRAQLYKQAGADCIYPITLADPAMISTLVGAVGPININLRRGGPLSQKQVEALGVRRVTYATSLFRETTVLVESIARDLREDGDASV